MSFYDEMQSVGSEIITEFAQGLVQFVRTVPGTGPAYDPGVPTETTVTVPATATGVNRRYVDGTQILQSDLQVIVPGDVGFVPQMSDRIMIDGRSYSAIVSVKQVPAAGTPVAIIVIFR